MDLTSVGDVLATAAERLSQAGIAESPQRRLVELLVDIPVRIVVLVVHAHGLDDGLHVLLGVVGQEPVLIRDGLDVEAIVVDELVQHVGAVLAAAEPDHGVVFVLALLALEFLPEQRLALFSVRQAGCE